MQFFSGLHFYTLLKTLIACRDMQLRFFKVKTLLTMPLKLIGYTYMNMYTKHTVSTAHGFIAQESVISLRHGRTFHTFSSSNACIK